MEFVNMYEHQNYITSNKL